MLLCCLAKCATYPCFFPQTVSWLRSVQVHTSAKGEAQHQQSRVDRVANRAGSSRCCPHCFSTLHRADICFFYLLFVGNGLSARQRYRPQRPQQQECVFGERQGGHFRLRPLQRQQVLLQLQVRRLSAGLGCVAVSILKYNSPSLPESAATSVCSRQCSGSATWRLRFCATCGRSTSSTKTCPSPSSPTSTLLG